jgi:hypothetical protein
MLDCRDDAQVGTTAAKVMVHRCDDPVAGGEGILLKQHKCVKEHSRRAIATLKRALIDEGLLERV